MWGERLECKWRNAVTRNGRSTICVLFKDFIYAFLEKVEGGEREGVIHQCQREIFIRLPLVHTWLGTEPTTQACALTGNPTDDFHFSGQHPINWATRVRAVEVQFKFRHYWGPHFYSSTMPCITCLCGNNLSERRTLTALLLLSQVQERRSLLLSIEQASTLCISPTHPQLHLQQAVWGHLMGFTVLRFFQPVFSLGRAKQ